MSSYAERTHSKASTKLLEIYKVLFQKRPPGMTQDRFGADVHRVPTVSESLIGPCRIEFSSQ